MKVIHAAPEWNGTGSAAVRTGGYILTTEDNEKHLIPAALLDGHPMSNEVFGEPYAYDDHEEPQTIGGKTMRVAKSFTADKLRRMNGGGATQLDAMPEHLAQAMATPKKTGRTKTVRLAPKIEKNERGEDCHVFPDDAPKGCPVHFDGKTGHYVFEVADTADDEEVKS